jgi:ACS family D-galactonate transporter-like MFS transporter
VLQPNRNISGEDLRSLRVVSLAGVQRWAIVGLLFGSSFINYLDRATLSVALPLISSDLQLDPSRKGLVLWSFFTSYAVMQLPIGWLVDRADLKWLYAAMFTLWSLSCGLTGFAHSMLMLIVFRVLLGIGESIYLPGGNKIVSLLFTRENRGLPSGLFDCGTRAGLAFGAPLTAWLIMRHGWRTMFFLIGFLAIAWLLPWVLLFPARLSSRADGVVTAPSKATRQQRRLITLNRDLVGLCLGFFCFGYYWYLLLTWLPDYLVKVRHLSILKAGVYAALPYLIFGISEPVGGWIADRLVRQGWDETLTRKGLVTVSFLTGILLIPAALVQDARAAIALMVGASLVGLATGNLLVILQDCAPPAELGAWTGVENFTGNLGGISALVTGYLIGKTGSYLPGFVLAVGILVLGLLAYWFVVGELRPKEASSP